MLNYLPALAARRVVIVGQVTHVAIDASDMVSKVTVQLLLACSTTSAHIFVLGDSGLGMNRRGTAAWWRDFLVFGYAHHNLCQLGELLLHHIHSAFALGFRWIGANIFDRLGGCLMLQLAISEADNLCFKIVGALEFLWISVLQPEAYM
jgi:hypothetical protein